MKQPLKGEVKIIIPIGDPLPQPKSFFGVISTEVDFPYILRILTIKSTQWVENNTKIEYTVIAKKVYCGTCKKEQVCNIDMDIEIDVLECWDERRK